MDKNVRLANDLLHVSLRVKHFHWTVRGNDALPLHEQLDELHDDLIGYSDRLFEDAFANEDDIGFEVGLTEGNDRFTTALVVNQLIQTFGILIKKTQEEGADKGRRGTGNILDDIAEGLTNWVYLFKLYLPPSE